VLRRSWNERVAAPVTASLRQGLTPEGIALSLAFGVAVGLFSVVGATTLLGLALGSALRLNLPGILGWTAVLPIVVLSLYLALLPVLRALEARLRPSRSGPADPPGVAPAEAR
jgi:uncharacterized protein (DUF2062 family)